jgi:drug/metabolite transporter (DMT)-like permease
MLSQYKNQLLLHFIILIWGFTGVLGKLIETSSDILVWYRMTIAFMSIAVFIYLSKEKFTVSAKNLLRFFLVGGIIATHWITFFESIKVSTVSIALSCMATASVFTALLEPLFFRKKINPVELTLGLVVIFGLYLIFEFETNYTLGIILAVFSAFCASLFTVINGVLVKKSSASGISLYEMIGGTVVISLYFLINGDYGLSDMAISFSDWSVCIDIGSGLHRLCFCGECSCDERT